MGILISFLILRVISAAISTRLLANTSFGKSPGIMIMTALLAFMFPFFTPAALFIVPRLQKWIKRTTTSPMQEEINKINQTAEANKAKLKEEAKTNIEVYQVLEKSLNEIEQRRQAMVEEVEMKYKTEDTVKRLGSYSKQELSEYLRNNQVSEDVIRRLADKVDWDTLKENPNLSHIDIDALHAKCLSSRFNFNQMGTNAANEHIETIRAGEQQEKAMQYVQMQTKAMEANKTEMQESKNSRRI